MKRSPMKRGTPLKRTPIKRSRPMSAGTPKPSLVPPLKSKKRNRPKRKTKYAMRERDFDYMEWVKLQYCLLAGIDGAGPCSGVVEADHAGLDSGLGQKAPDRTCIPLCSEHHRNRHHKVGFFRGRPRQWIREWRLNAIDETQEEHQRCGGGAIDVQF